MRMSTNLTQIEKYIWHRITWWYEIVSKWWDYEVIVYDWHIYRFPRPDKLMDIALEKRKLDIIKPYISLPIPDFTIIDNTFIVYPIIPWKTFDDCIQEYDDDFITSLVWFIKELHSIPLESFTFLQTDKEQTNEEKQWFKNWVESTKNGIKTRLQNKCSNNTIQNILTYIDTLFFSFESPKKAFVHADI